MIDILYICFFNNPIFSGWVIWSAYPHAPQNIKDVETPLESQISIRGCSFPLA